MKRYIAGMFFILMLFGMAYQSITEHEEAAEAALRPTTGVASWYGESYRGLPMANGQPYDPDAMTCATWAYPLGTVLHVRAVGGYSVVKVTVTDRGPAQRLNRLIDLTPRAFAQIAPLDAGIVMVEVRP